MTALALTIKSETPKAVTVAWSPPAGAIGYVYFRDGKRTSNTWDATTSQVTFGKPDSGQHVYAVEAVGVVASGEVSLPAPLPPPGGNVPAPPVGPFKKSTPVFYRTASAPQEIAGLDVENYAGKVIGIGVMQWPPHDGPLPGWHLHDCITQNIGDVPPSSNGTAEAGVWAGQPGLYERFVADGSWEGLWTGAMLHDSVLADFIVGKADGKGGWTLPSGGVAGVYLEHFTRRNIFDRFDVTPLGKHGFNIEWWYADSTYAPFVEAEYPAALAGKAGSCVNTIQNGRVYCPAGGFGIFADAGSWGHSVQAVEFYGPGAAVAFPNHLAGPNPNVLVQTGPNACTFNQAGPNLTMHNNQIGEVHGELYGIDPVLAHLFDGHDVRRAPHQNVLDSHRQIRAAALHALHDQPMYP